MYIKGKKIGLSDVFEAVGKHQTGEMDDAELLISKIRHCPTCGSCSGMYTANTMNCLTEALGMGLPAMVQSQRYILNVCV